MSGTLRIGTSGWHYSHWIGPFYPAGIPKRNLLPLYAEHFDTTELNAPFYRLPTEATVEKWARETPEDFLFAWKASRYVTHIKRLLDVGDSVKLMMDRASGLGDKLGPVLWQLPPSLHRDDERLASFLKLLRGNRSHTVEFRHRSWFDPEVFRLLADHGVAFCISDHAYAPSPWEATAGFVYIRAHGTNGRYWGSYSDATQAGYATRIRAYREEGRTVFCYFDNDNQAAAPGDAKYLLSLLREPERLTPEAAAE
jgi:uncharacterized protein YecE (DUF72 family)